MIGLTLGSYFARHFLRWTLMIFALFVLLIMAVDVVELLRRAPGDAENAASKALQIAFFRAPNFAKFVIPFAVLFGATISLLVLNRKLELVIVRASGVSVWQFLLPYAVVSVFLGLISGLAYEPVSQAALKMSRAAEVGLFGRVRSGFASSSRNFWARVAQKDGDAIVRAAISENGGTRLSAVSIYRFDKSGASIERIDAESARFLDGEGQTRYELTNATVTTPGEAGVKIEKLSLPVETTAAELQINATSPDSLDYWALGEQARRARAAGRNHLQFLTRQQSLLSQPLLFFAMVLLAACVSLRFARFGQSGTRILAGVSAGFVLYVASVIVLTFGSNGLVSPVMAAWSPAFVASLIGITVLLHQEDG